MNSFRLFFVVWLLSRTLAIAQTDSTLVSVAVVDEVTNSPIPGVKVEVAVNSSIGNITYSIMDRYLLGYTDSCGFLEKMVPNNISKYGLHGSYMTDRFWLVFSDCLYGEGIGFYHFTDTHFALKLYKPINTDIRVLTDASKSFVTLKWRVAGFGFIYSVMNSYRWMFGKTATLRKDGELLFTQALEGTGEKIYEFTYTDFDVAKGQKLKYLLAGNPLDHTAGCPTPVDTVAFELNDALPDSVTFVPKILRSCNSTVSNINVECLIGDSIIIPKSRFGGAFRFMYGDSLQFIKVLSKPGYGRLELDGQPVVEQQEISVADLAFLQYTPEAGYAGADFWSYQGSNDLGYSNNTAKVKIHVVASITGIEKIEQYIQVYPNPFSGRINIRINDKHAKLRFMKVVDMQGREWVSISNPGTMDTSIDLSTLASGLYILQVGSNDQVYYYKVRKE